MISQDISVATVSFWMYHLRQTGAQALTDTQLLNSTQRAPLSLRRVYRLCALNTTLLTVRGDLRQIDA
jgi:hypothetical protein